MFRSTVRSSRYIHSRSRITLVVFPSICQFERPLIARTCTPVGTTRHLRSDHDCSELVLTYLGESECNALLQWCGSYLCTSATSVFVAYEPLGPRQDENSNSDICVLEAYKRAYSRSFFEQLNRGTNTTAGAATHHVPTLLRSRPRTIFRQWLWAHLCCHCWSSGLVCGTKKRFHQQVTRARTV
jgi:hypothetical protein